MAADPPMPSQRRADAKHLLKALVKGGISVAPYGGAVTELANALERRRDDRALETLESVVGALGIEFDHLCRMLMEDEKLANLWQRALIASRASRIETKRQAFAAIMTGAVTSTPQDRTAANVLVRLLDQLEDEHLELVATIKSNAATPQLDSEGKKLGPRGADIELLKKSLPHLASVMELLLSSLVSLTIIKNSWQNTYDGFEGRKTAFVLADIGHRIMKLLLTD